MEVILIIALICIHSAFAQETLDRVRNCSLVVNIATSTYVWDLARNTSKVFDRITLNESSYDKPFQNQGRNNNHSLFYMPQRYVARRFLNSTNDPFTLFPKLQQHYDAHFKEISIRNQVLDDLFRTNESNSRREMVVFRNVLTNNYGLIVFPDTCEYVRNGGCLYMHHKRIYTIPAKNGSVSFLNYRSVVSLTAGAFGTWHFPMELLVSLAGMPEFILNDTSTVYHVPIKSNFVMNWLSLAGISPSQVVSSPVIRAETLWVPQMAQCGRPTPSQLSWLRSRLAGLPGDGHEAKEHALLYVCRSTKSRRVKNAENLEHQLRFWAKAMGYQFILHDDKLLPTLQVQIELFSKATIVVAPHGAGLLFTAFSPNNACILEFMPDTEPYPEIYARLAYLRGLNYRLSLMSMAGSSKKFHSMNISDVEEGLYQCVLRQHTVVSDGLHSQALPFIKLPTNITKKFHSSENIQKPTSAFKSPTSKTPHPLHRAKTSQMHHMHRTNATEKSQTNIMNGEITHSIMLHKKQNWNNYYSSIIYQIFKEKQKSLSLKPNTS